MATRTSHGQANVGPASEQLAKPTLENDVRRTAPRLTSERVWQAVAKASFAVLSHVTPVGEPRSSGVVYKAVGRRLYIAVAPDSWKAKHVPAKGRVAVTVPVQRGGLLSLATPIPPATISFHGTAMVHPAGSPQAVSLLQEIGSLVPAERRASAAVIEIIPEGIFLTYGLGVPLRTMLDPAAARARVPVMSEGERPMTVLVTDPKRRAWMTPSMSLR
jgi:Pyridoxamine 5'-phosphate oxidase